MTQRPPRQSRSDASPARHESVPAEQVPERAALLEALEAAGRPCSLRDLAETLGVVHKPALEATKRRLMAMTRDGQIVRTRGNRFGIASAMELLKGRVMGHPDGFAFVRPDEATGDIFIGRREARRILSGDRVLVRVAGMDERGRPYGQVVEILERANHDVVGRFFREGGIGFVVPDNRNINQDILIQPGPDGTGLKAKNGQIVVAHIDQQPDEHHQPIGSIAEILGDHMAPGMEVDIAVRTHGLPTEWSQDVEAVIADIPETVSAAECEGRTDLRDLPFVTIDGADARDFDDAVYCKKVRGGFQLYVAIADVAHYVVEGEPLDVAARERGTSVYFPNRVIPMLPEELSNGICSLNPKVDRLALVCEMRFSTAGECTKHRFFNGVIHSQARLIYEDVAAWLTEAAPAHDPVRENVANLRVLYAALRERREERGALDIDTVEPLFIFNPERRIERVEARTRNDAHKLIEECMISANVAAALELIGHEQPAMFRIHGTPAEDRVEELRTMLAEMGVALSGGSKPTPRDFSRVLLAARSRPDKTLVETAVLRSLKLAVYSAENAGHFGLGLEAYTHFTSPIRRYPDLVVHRALKQRIARRRARSETDMAALAEHCSMTERRAEDASRDVIAWLKCEYMEDKVGDRFRGIVSNVTAFGVFVQLEDIFVEGLVHVTELPDDYYQFDPVRRTLAGRSSKRVYRIGEPIEVIVTRVSLEDRRIDLRAADASRETKRPRRRR